MTRPLGPSRIHTGSRAHLAAAKLFIGGAHECRPAEDLLRTVAGAAKLKRLWRQVAQLFNPVRLVARIPSRLGRPGINLMKNPMINAKESVEPPSWARPRLFTIGQDSQGHWVVQDQKGICGGLFVDRDAALRFVRAENGYRPAIVVMVSENIELKVSRDPPVALHHGSAADLELRRRSA
jgi:hypothetical protein